MQNLNNFGYDFYKIKQINQEIFSNIKLNINYFLKLAESYKNILFICGDYPGYGGAATNCHSLHNLFKKRGHNTTAFYYYFSKNEQHNNYDIRIE